LDECKPLLRELHGKAERKTERGSGTPGKAAAAAPSPSESVSESSGGGVIEEFAAYRLLYAAAQARPGS
jgi:hypothetical protein